ncbi:MAG: peptidoglycan DD-metalloendopeptidase family protein [Chloroflexaceae bacterium]
MIHLHHLRRSRALTFLDLSHLTGLPPRVIAEAEYGLRTLTPQEAQRLALVFDLADATQLTQPLHIPYPTPAQAMARSRRSAWIIALLLLVVLIGFGGLHLLPAGLPAEASAARPAQRLAAVSAAGSTRRAALPATASATVTLVPTATASASPTTPAEMRRLAAQSPVLPTLTPMPTPTATPLLTATPLPTAIPTIVPAAASSIHAFSLGEGGPVGCPLQPATGRVVMTQGYGVGSHEPADVWGAVDLAVDGNGDGSADRDATLYTPVVATHCGVVQVSLDSWPGGNHVWLTDPSSGWSTGYAHLAFVMVEHGQTVMPGAYLGLAGSTGQSSGPHLDYQVWYGGTNIDPTSLVSICR